MPMSRHNSGEWALGTGVVERGEAVGFGLKVGHLTDVAERAVNGGIVSRINQVQCECWKRASCRFNTARFGCGPPAVGPPPALQVHEAHRERPPHDGAMIE